MAQPGCRLVEEEQGRADVEHMWQDQGVQTFRMLLVAHPGSWREAALPRKTKEFLPPVPVIYQGIHPGARPQQDSFLSLNAPNMIISSVKKSEEGDDFVIRAYETDGRPTSSAISLRHKDGSWHGSFRPYEIKTIRINQQPGCMKEADALEK